MLKFIASMPQQAAAYLQLLVKVETGSVVLMPLVKRLDAHQAVTLRMALLNQIDAQGPGHLIVDLSYVEWMDSSALAVLVTAFQRTGRSGGSFAVRTLHDRVRALFAETRLDRVIPLSDSAHVMVFAPEVAARQSSLGGLNSLPRVDEYLGRGSPLLSLVDGS